MDIPPATTDDAFESQAAGVRVTLWQKCPHIGKYGDDGELQCRGADFKVDSISSLIDHVIQAAFETA